MHSCSWLNGWERRNAVLTSAILILNPLVSIADRASLSVALRAVGGWFFTFLLLASLSSNPLTQSLDFPMPGFFHLLSTREVRTCAPCGMSFIRTFSTTPCSSIEAHSFLSANPNAASSLATSIKVSSSLLLFCFLVS